MSIPSYTAPTLLNYNASPPPDDGTQVIGNLATWAGIKTKLGDPLKTYADAINTAISATVASIKQLYSVVTAKSANFNVASSDDGTLFVCSGNTTATLPLAATMASGGRVGFKKTDSAATTLTIATTSSELIDGATSLTIAMQYGEVLLRTNGVVWELADVRGHEDGTVALPNYFRTDPDTGPYRIGANSMGIAAGGVAAWITSAAGEITMPLQPAFLARKSATTVDQTGDGTEYTVIPDTEVIDRNADYNNSTGVFTAPATGLYYLGMQIFLLQLAVGFTGIVLKIATSNRSYAANFNPGAVRDAANQFGMPMCQLCDMDAADVASITVTVSGSTKTVDIFGGTGPDTNFWGMLAA